jgi:hypothetical protein
MFKNITKSRNFRIGLGVFLFACCGLSYLNGSDSRETRATETHIAKFTQVVIAVSQTAAVTQTAMSMPTEAPSATQSETPIPLPTDTPAPTNIPATATSQPAFVAATNTTAPQANVQQAATQSAGDVLRNRIATVEGVQRVGIASVLYDRAGLPLVNLELIVASGRNNLTMADAVLQATTNALGISQYSFFSVILDDGSASDYVFDFASNTWRITQLRLVTPQGDSSNQQISNPTLPPATNAPAQTYYVTSAANIRPCPRTTSDCAFIRQLTSGQTVNVVGQEQGESVNSSTLWYRLDDGNYVHSGVVSLNAPVQAQQSGGGTTSSGGGGFATTAPVSSGATCDCNSGDTMNCTTHFTTQSQAQACFNYCMSVVGIDVHKLDNPDNDGIACESLP